MMNPLPVLYLLLFLIFQPSLSLDPYSFNYPQYIRFHWKGALTSHSIILKTFPNTNQLQSSQYYTFLAYYTKPSNSPTNIQLTSIVFPNEDYPVSNLSITGLSPMTRYYYSYIFTQDSTLTSTDFLTAYSTANSPPEFSFQTFSPALTPFNFTFGAASCAKTGSNHPVFQTLVQESFDFFVHMGDLHYEDIHRNDLPAFYSAYYTVFSHRNQRAFFESTPIYYLFDDHDFGKNDAKGTSPSKPAATSAFDHFVPHTVLKNYLPSDDSVDVAGAPAGNTNSLYYLTYNTQDYGIFRSFIVGRCLFVIMDLRSFQDVIPEDILGEEQKNWIENQIRYAGSTTGIQQVIFVSSVPWVNRDGGILKEGSTWDDYKHTQDMIGDLIKLHLYDNNKKAILIAGDAHMLALDDGRNNLHGGFPVVQAASLDRKGSCKGGPYSHGVHKGNNKFSRIEVTDYGNDTVCVKIYLKQGMESLITYDTCRPEMYPGNQYACPISWKGWVLIIGSAVGFVILVGVIGYCVYDWVRKRRLTKARKLVKKNTIMDKVKYVNTRQDSKPDLEEDEVVTKRGKLTGKEVIVENRNEEEEKEMEDDKPRIAVSFSKDKEDKEADSGSLLKLPGMGGKSDLLDTKLKTRSDEDLSGLQLQLESNNGKLSPALVMKNKFS